MLKLCLCLSNNILPKAMYVRNAIGGHTMPVGAMPCQWGPYHASGGRTMPVETLPCKRGPYQDSCGRTMPVGAVPCQWGPYHASGGRTMPVGAVPWQWGPYYANVIMNNMKKLCLLRKQIVNLSLADTKLVLTFSVPV